MKNLLLITLIAIFTMSTKSGVAQSSKKTDYALKSMDINKYKADYKFGLWYKFKVNQKVAFDLSTGYKHYLTVIKPVDVATKGFGIGTGIYIKF